MSTPEHESESHALELNKETLQDLEVGTDAQGVKGGANTTMSDHTCGVAAPILSARCQITPYKGGEITPYKGAQSL